MLKVAVEKGAEVAEGDLVCVIEAMKMENEITAPRAGKVTELAVGEGGSVNAGDPIATIEEAARGRPRSRRSLARPQRRAPRAAAAAGQAAAAPRRPVAQALALRRRRSPTR